MAAATYCKLVYVLPLLSFFSLFLTPGGFRRRQNQTQSLLENTVRTVEFYTDSSSCRMKSSSTCEPSLCASTSLAGDTCCTLLRYIKSTQGGMCWTNVCSQLLSMFPTQCAHLKGPPAIQVPSGLPSGANLPAGVIVTGPGAGAGGDFMSSVQMTLKTLLAQSPTASSTTGSQIEDAIQEGVKKAIAEQMVTLKKELKVEAHALWESLIPDLSKRIDDAIFKNNADQRSRLGKSVAALTKDIGDAVSSHMKAFTEDLMVDDMPREDAPVESDGKDQEEGQEGSSGEQQEEGQDGLLKEQQGTADGSGEDVPTMVGKPMTFLVAK
eukprot:TRINITY_DN8531_c1_g1_i2.p1 TRINITY_DN8531_c1_g1~~TRINITY_DN8531_c1_g1_i2.p1  ORF type:complete len:349 (-),score=66.63 TRINITY_DN8531_c1_g1_i2:137-1108(-)